MCFLVVSMMNNHIYGSEVPKTPILWAWIGISSQICEKFKYLYLQICVSDWHEIWQAAAASNILRGWSRMVVKQFQDGGRPPFWKLIYRHISVNKNLAIANRSRVSSAQNTLRASIGIYITLWPWNLGERSLKVTGNGTIGSYTT